MHTDTKTKHTQRDWFTITSELLLVDDTKTGETKIIIGPFWHEVFTETYEEGDDDISTTTTEPLPFFEDDASTSNVTAQLGSRVHLHCRVHDLGEKTISWVRRRGDDLHLLSFGRHTYSADSRYSLAFEQPNDWRLLIQYVSERDEGYYECQISTHPPLVRRVHLAVIERLDYRKRRRFAIHPTSYAKDPPTSNVNNLNLAHVFSDSEIRIMPLPIFVIRVPRVEIVDERGRPIQDKFYKEGSIIELRCLVSEVPESTRQVIWKNGERLLNYDTKRGGIR
ncbi:unnamed protein product [Leptidea sinapis]|uniref:Ig-like domain-containing protein n=1 Tax=Leptidea sinapis TaxID=189913 RepID=A0A5E4QPZ1_9NEOP|nr:unnamed protein product [Leptidea sinapis]